MNVNPGARIRVVKDRKPVDASFLRMTETADVFYVTDEGAIDHTTYQHVTFLVDPAKRVLQDIVENAYQNLPISDELLARAVKAIQ
jgi:hypothetical protein